VRSVDLAQLVKIFNEYVKKKDNVGLVEWLASLPDEDRRKLLDYVGKEYAKKNIDLNKVLSDLAKNYVAKTNKSFDEYVKAFRKIFGDSIPSDVLDYAADTVLVRMFENVRKNPSPEAVKKLVEAFEELSKYITNEERKHEIGHAILTLCLAKASEAYRSNNVATAKAYLELAKKLEAFATQSERSKIELLDINTAIRGTKVEQFVDSVNKKRYYDAWRIYQSMTNEERELLKKYLALNGYNFDQIINAVKWNAFWEKAKACTTVSELAKVVEEFFGKSKTIEEARKFEQFMNLLKEKRFDEAISMIEKEPSPENAKKMLATLIATIDYENYTKYKDRIARIAERVGMHDVVENIRESDSLMQSIDKMASEIRSVAEDAVAEALITTIATAVKNRDVATLMELLEKYSHELGVKLNGQDLCDVLRGAIAFVGIKNLLDDVVPKYTKLVENLQEYLNQITNPQEPTIGTRPTVPRIEFSLSELDELERKLEELERKVRNRLPELKAFFSALNLGNVNEFLSKLDEATKLVRFAKALKLVDENRPFEALDVAKDLREDWRAFVLARAIERILINPPPLEDVLCMLQSVGITPSATPGIEIRTSRGAIRFGTRWATL